MTKLCITVILDELITIIFIVVSAKSLYIFYTHGIKKNMTYITIQFYNIL